MISCKCQAQAKAETQAWRVYLPVTAATSRYLLINTHQQRRFSCSREPTPPAALCVANRGYPTSHQMSDWATPARPSIWELQRYAITLADWVPASQPLLRAWLGPLCLPCCKVPVPWPVHTRLCSVRGPDSRPQYNRSCTPYVNLNGSQCLRLRFFIIHVVQ